MTLEINPREAHERLRRGTAVLIDVREPWEFAIVHAPRAELVPLGELGSRLDDMPRDREILFICQTGSRSLAAAGWAREAGLNAVSVAGGTSVWRLHGLPVEVGS